MDIEKKLNPETDSEKIQREKELRTDEVASLVKLAQGNRSNKEFAQDAGVSPSSLTKLYKNKGFLPSYAFLAKCARAADPQSGVTLNDLTRAAGYGDNLLKVDPEAEREEYIERIEELEKECTTQIYSALVENGFVLTKGDNEVGNDKCNYRRHCDLVVELMEQPVKKWVFDFRFSLGDRAGMGMAFHLPIASAVALGSQPDMKYSVVVNTRMEYEQFKRFDHALAYRGEFSVILYNTEKKLFTDECYLSNYNEGDTSREIFLVEN